MRFSCSFSVPPAHCADPPMSKVFVSPTFLLIRILLLLCGSCSLVDSSFVVSCFVGSSFIDSWWWLLVSRWEVCKSIFLYVVWSSPSSCSSVAAAFIGGAGVLVLFRGCCDGGDDVSGCGGDCEDGWW